MGCAKGPLASFAGLRPGSTLLDCCRNSTPRAGERGSGIEAAGPDEPERAFEWLERGYAERSALMMWLRWPAWSLLQGDRRYGDLMRRLGLGV
jgi:hypothetical protein